MASWLVCIGYDSKEREMGEAMVVPHMMFSLFYFGAEVPISHIYDKSIFCDAMVEQLLALRCIC